MDHGNNGSCAVSEDGWLYLADMTVTTPSTRENTTAFAVTSLWVAFDSGCGDATDDSE